MTSLLIQQVLTGLSSMGVVPDAPQLNATTAGNATVASPTATPFTMPTNLSGLVALLFSLSALRDWLKLIIIGGFFETCRRLIFSTWGTVIRSFWVTAYFKEDDSSYGASSLSSHRF